MSHFGIRGNAFSWFQSYLNDRLISVDQLFCSPSKVNFDVPQGSVLGPVLLLIYVNDIFYAVKCRNLLNGVDSVILSLPLPIVPTIVRPLLMSLLVFLMTAHLALREIANLSFD